MRKPWLLEPWGWILAGGLLGLSAPGFGLWPLAWIGLIPFFYGVTKAPSWQKGFQRGLFFGAGYHYTYLCWYLGLHPTTWMGFSPVESIGVALGAWSLAALYGALFIGILAICFWLGSRHLPKGLTFLIFPLLWIMVFWGFKQTDFGVPWALLEYTQSGLPAMRHVASLSGKLLGDSSAITYLLLLHNLGWAHWFLTKPPRARSLALLLLLPGLVGLSSFLLPPSKTLKLPLPVAILQGNLPIDVIRSADLANTAAVDAYRTPLLKHPFPPGTLVILPEEGAVPGWVSLTDPLTNPYLKALAQTAWQQQVHLMAGISAYDPKTQATYNSIILIPSTPGPFQIYHKRRLVPFGEYTPYVNARWAASQLSALGVSYETSFQRGREGKLLEQGKYNHQPPLKIGGLICFELIYPELSHAYKAQGANLLINTSNLGWFHGNSWLEEQFLAIGQLRAAETHLPLIISTNSGVSAILSPEGEILKRTSSEQKALLFAP